VNEIIFTIKNNPNYAGTNYGVRNIFYADKISGYFFNYIAPIFYGLDNFIAAEYHKNMSITY